MERYFGENIPKLGFGLMRLPKEESGKIDLEQTKKMVDLFMEAGQTYFDTAYTYDNGDSELTAKAALVERYPRESFTLATKINANKEGCDEQSVKQQFYTSLERAQDISIIICFMPFSPEVIKRMNSTACGIL